MIEAMKQALEALEGLINKTSGQAIYSFMETERRIAMSACVGLRQAIQEEALRNVQRLGQEIEEEAEKQELFGFFQYDLRLDAWVQNRNSDKGVAFYTHPQPKHEENGVCLKCGLATHGPQPKARTGNCLLTGVCASEGCKIQPKREPDYNICPTCGGMADDPIVPPEHRRREWVGLTDEDFDEVYEAACRSLRRHHAGVQGQQITPADSLEWHIMLQTEAKLKEKNT